MRNPTYALVILLCAAVMAVMTGCDYDPSPSFTYEVYLIDADGENLQHLFPAFSGIYGIVTADGEYLAYVTPSCYTRYCIETGEKQSYDLFFDQIKEYAPSVDEIYCQAKLGGVWGFYTVDVMTGKVTAVPSVQSSTQMLWNVAYHRKEILYSVCQDSVYSLRRVNVTTGADELLHENAEREYTSLAAAPDGNAVYLCSRSDVDSLDGNFRLQIDTQEMKRIESHYNVIAVGLDEQFVITRHGPLMLDVDHNVVEAIGLGTDCQLLGNFTEIVYRPFSNSVMKYRFPSGDTQTICYYDPGYWVSCEGRLIKFTQTSYGPLP